MARELRRFHQTPDAVIFFGLINNPPRDPQIFPTENPSGIASG